MVEDRGFFGKAGGGGGLSSALKLLVRGKNRKLTHQVVESPLVDTNEL